ncbi:MAG: methyltransferase domain-containing protein [Myxococcaceae bacterium]
MRPTLSDVADTDWERLRGERIDTVVLSNVLEHIEDDAGAVAGFRRLLPPGGRVVILVPALPSLFGAMDEAVGHFRRYSREGLQQLLDGGGFEVERLEWMNLASIPGWFVNGRVFRRRSVPPLQLRLYDRVLPLIGRLEGLMPRLPVGMNLFAVARVR